METEILSSGEFYDRISGDDRDAFLDKLYQVVLHRPIDSAGREAFDRELLQGASRASVVAAVLDSPEHEQLAVERLYLQLLTRHVDSLGLEFFRSRLAAGASLDSVITQLAASDEYYSGL